MMAPPAKTSGYVASITEAMAPPAERPVTNTLRRSVANVAMACSTISLIESASPWPRAMSPGKNQETILRIVGGLLLRIDHREAQTVGEGRPAGAVIILV